MKRKRFTNFKRAMKLANSDCSTGQSSINVDQVALSHWVESSHFFSAVFDLKRRNVGAEVVSELAPDRVPPVRIVLGDLGQIISEGRASAAMIESKEAWGVGVAKRIRFAPGFRVGLSGSVPEVHESLIKGDLAKRWLGRGVVAGDIDLVEEGFDDVVVGAFGFIFDQIVEGLNVLLGKICNEGLPCNPGRLALWWGPEPRKKR